MNVAESAGELRGDPPDQGRDRWQNLRANLPAITVMLLAVSLQLLGAVLLKTLADNRLAWSLTLLVAGVGAVLLLNLVRLGVWGYANSRFPLSTTFPLSSLFFPGLLLVAIAFGDDVGATQVIGAACITGGTMWLSVRVSS
jgi:uncharacterized membrane protein